MANAAVEKLKVLGLRHGEKAVVALVAALCLLFFGMAIAHPTIQLTPDQVNKDAEAARTNINRNHSQEEIAGQLETDEIKQANFLAEVEKRQTGDKTAEPYRLANTFVAPEPGAGLLRETPELIAPEHLLAHAGRGATKVFATDKETGERIYVNPEDQQEKPRRKRRSGMSGMGGGSGGYGMMGGFGGSSKKGRARAKAEEEKEEAIEKRRTQGAVAAGDESIKPKGKEAEEAEEPQGEYKQALRGIRWVSVLGTFDHKKQRELYAKALKVDFASANPHYLRLDVERQELQDDGTWPEEWSKVDAKENSEVLDNIVEREEELTPEDVRLKGLVDMLPFLSSGYWRQVHYGPLIPDEKNPLKEKPKPKDAGMGGYPGMMAGMMGSGGYGGGYGRGSEGGGDPSAGYGRRMAMAGGAYGGSSAMGGYPGGYGGAGMGGPEDSGFATSNADTVMIRSLDFTVQPDTTYRFRLRVVVRNPNFHREDVQAGVSTTDEELSGPWSEPTDPVTVPADVTTYAQKPTPGDPEKITFGVARWDPESGYTIFRHYDEGPGQIIGEGSRATIPSEDGAKTVVKPLDFTSHQLVLDTMGGDRSLERFDLGGNRLEAPAQALLVRNDGTLVVRDQAIDARSDSEMKELESIYQQTLDEVKKGTKKKRPMGGYGSGMGGGYPSMGSGRGR
jgi:hypothetical protein